MKKTEKKYTPIVRIDMEKTISQKMRGRGLADTPNKIPLQLTVCKSIKVSRDDPINVLEDTLNKIIIMENFPVNEIYGMLSPDNLAVLLPSQFISRERIEQAINKMAYGYRF